MKKRILPALLALCMVMSLLPTMVFADEAPAKKEVECTCKATAHPEGHEAKFEGDEDGLCAACKADARCNPCDIPTCTGVKDHETAHTNTTCPGTIKATEGATCGAETHTGECGMKCDFPGCTLTNGHKKDGKASAHNNSACAGKGSNGLCGATTHKSGCDLYCTKVKGCTAEKHSKDCVEACCNAAEGGVAGCTLTADHEAKHDVSFCTKDGDKCPADIHDPACAAACGAGKAEADEEAGTEAVVGCTRTKNHKGKHNADVCIKDTTAKTAAESTCGAPAGTHDKTCKSYVACGAGKDDKGENGCDLDKGHSGNHTNTTCAKIPGCGASEHDPKCPNVCGLGGCTLTAGHQNGEEGTDHNNEKCLGVNDDGHCASTLKEGEEHITGCTKYCTCPDDDAHKNCTHEADCPVCAALGEDCTCLACKAKIGPATGAVVDNDGEEVDPAEPTEPTVPEVPEKAADFTDIDGDDASQEWLVEAVQTMLDNGWMQGVGGSKFEPGVDANTGMVLTVVARMYGEKGIEGADYANLAKAWAEKNDLAEGIDLESDTIARKDIILLLWRLAGKTDSTQALEFTDVEGLEGDYLTALKWAVEKGIVKGNGDGTVSPDGILTRGQLAALVARYADNVK